MALLIRNNDGQSKELKVKYVAGWSTGCFQDDLQKAIDQLDGVLFDIKYSVVAGTFDHPSALILYYEK